MKQTQYKIQNDTDYDTSHDRKVKAAVFSGNMDITRQVSQRQEIRAKLHDDSDNHQKNSQGNEHSPHRLTSSVDDKEVQADGLDFLIIILHHFVVRSPCDCAEGSDSELSAAFYLSKAPHKAGWVYITNYATPGKAFT